MVQSHSNWNLDESVSLLAGVSRPWVSFPPGLVLMCGATCCGWAITTQAWRMSLRGSCPWNGSSSTGTTGLAATITTLPWSGCEAERGTVSPSITTFCLSVYPTGKRSLTSTGKLASSLAGETQVSDGVLRSKKGGGVWVQEPTWAINLCLHNSRPCSHCSYCLCQHMVSRSGEVRWFLCHCVFFWFWGFLSLPTVEVLVAIASSRSCGREQCTHLATVLFLPPPTHVVAHSRPLRQQPVQRWCTKPMGGPYVSMTSCLFHGTVIVKWGLRGGRNVRLPCLISLVIAAGTVGLWGWFLHWVWDSLYLSSCRTLLWSFLDKREQRIF